MTKLAAKRPIGMPRSLKGTAEKVTAVFEHQLRESLSRFRNDMIVFERGRVEDRHVITWELCGPSKVQSYFSKTSVMISLITLDA